MQMPVTAPIAWPRETAVPWSQSQIIDKSLSFHGWASNYIWLVGFSLKQTRTNLLARSSLVSRHGIDRPVARMPGLLLEMAEPGRRLGHHATTAALTFSLRDLGNYETSDTSFHRAEVFLARHGPLRH